MTFIGKKARADMVGHGQFHCSFCKSLALYIELEIQHRFHFFWLPLFTAGPKEHAVLCQKCQGMLPAEVLDVGDSFPIPWPPGSHLQDRPRPRLDGERVLARWPFEPFWYPACVEQRDDDRVYVHYDDGHKACLPSSQVTDLDLNVGDQVFARWKRGAIYHPGEITRKIGEEIHIRYDDGDWEETTISVVRVLRDNDDQADGEEQRWRSGRY